MLLNWYKFIKYSQYYDEIKREDYEDEDEFKAIQYFSIGQDDDRKPGFCWIWLNDQLEVKRGKTHPANFGFKADNLFRGWYDPEQELVSVVVPRSIHDRFSTFTISDVPTGLSTALRKRFGRKFKVKVF